MANRDGVFFRNKSFYISWTDIHGKRKKQKTNAATPAEAKAIRAEKLRKVAQAEVLGFLPPSDNSFEQIATEYLASQKVNLSDKGYEREHGIFELHLKKHFVGPLASIRHAQIERYLIKRHTAGASPYTIRKELQVIKHVFAFAVAFEYLPTSPAMKVKGPKEPTGRIRYLGSIEEVRTMLSACPPWLRPIAALSLASGMRQGEVLGLRPMDIDEKRQIAILRETKNNTFRFVPLNSHAMAIVKGAIDSAPKRTSPLFTVDTRNMVSTAFKRAAKKAGISDFRFHDLRHTFASFAIQNGMGLRTLADILGHKNLKMVMRYAHLSPQFLENEVRRMDGVFMGMLSGDDRGTIEAGNVSLPVPACLTEKSGKAAKTLAITA